MLNATICVWKMIATAPNGTELDITLLFRYLESISLEYQLVIIHYTNNELLLTINLLVIIYNELLPIITNIGW